jgi:hypothetical protein
MGISYSFSGELFKDLSVFRFYSFGCRMIDELEGIWKEVVIDQ